MKNASLFFAILSSGLFFFTSLSHAQVSECARERLDQMQCEQEIRNGQHDPNTQCPGVSPACYGNGSDSNDGGGSGISSCARERLDNMQCEQSARNAGLDPNAVCAPVSAGCL